MPAAVTHYPFQSCKPWGLFFCRSSNSVLCPCGEDEIRGFHPFLVQVFLHQQAQHDSAVTNSCQGDRPEN